MVGMILFAGVIFVRCREAEWRFLLLRAFRGWDSPKGEIEAGEDPLDAAVRGVAEDTALTDLRFRWGTATTGPSATGVARWRATISPRRHGVDLGAGATSKCSRCE